MRTTIINAVLAFSALGSVSGYAKSGGNASIPLGANPFENIGWYVDPEYTQKVNASVNIITNTTLANLANMAGNTPTSIWLSSQAVVNTRLPVVLSDARSMNLVRTDQFGPLTASFFIYNLPGRDCASQSKPGEYPANSTGLDGYKKFINSIYTQVKAYPDVRVIGILEPDAVANMVMSPNDPNSRCGQAKPFYQQGLQYAISTFGNLTNMATYLDVGHAKWNGAVQDQAVTATVVQSIHNNTAPYKVRGFHTNRAQYIPVKTTDGSLGALDFAIQLGNRFKALNMSSKFLIDTSRNGIALSNVYTWCNVIGSGMGFRPTNVTANSTYLDAYVWSQAGESDGTSNTMSPRYDWSCDTSISLKPSPEQGTWFHNFFTQLVQNARPPLDAGRPAV